MERDDGDSVSTALERGEWTLSDEETRQYVQIATKGVVSLVRSTLGPRGLEKQIRTWDHQGDPETVQTGDASVILDAIERGEGFNHPVAALFTDCVDSMQRGLGDGTTTAIVLAGALIERGIELIDEGVHPGTIAVGYALAASRAGTVLDTLARTGPPDQTDLRQVAKTSMTADIADETRVEYATQVSEAIQGKASGSDWLDTDDVAVVVKTGETPALLQGIVIRQRPDPLDESPETEAGSEFDWEQSVPEPIPTATVAILDREIDFERTATNFEDGVHIDPGQIADYRAELAERHNETATRFERMGIDVLVSQPEIDDTVRETFRNHRICVVDEVKYPLSDIYRLARATGASVVSHPDDVTPETLGSAGAVRTRRVDDEIWTTFDECEGGVFTVVADARTETGAIQRERLIEDAIEVTALAVIDEQLLPGAGAPAMAVATDLRTFAPSVPGREQLAVSAFADALETVVSTLATNAGIDPIDALAALRAAHARTDTDPASFGLSVSGDPVDAWDVGIVEPRRVFSQAVETARSATEQLLTVDRVVFPGVELDAYTPRVEHD